MMWQLRQNSGRDVYQPAPPTTTNAVASSVPKSDAPWTKIQRAVFHSLRRRSLRGDRAGAAGAEEVSPWAEGGSGLAASGWLIVVLSCHSRPA